MSDIELVWALFCGWLGGKAENGKNSMAQEKVVLGLANKDPKYDCPEYDFIRIPFCRTFDAFIEKYKDDRGLPQDTPHYLEAKGGCGNTIDYILHVGEYKTRLDLKCHRNPYCTIPQFADVTETSKNAQRWFSVSFSPKAYEGLLDIGKILGISISISMIEYIKWVCNFSNKHPELKQLSDTVKKVKETHKAAGGRGNPSQVAEIKKLSDAAICSHIPKAARSIHIEIINEYLKDRKEQYILHCCCKKKKELEFHIEATQAEEYKATHLIGFDKNKLVLQSANPTTLILMTLRWKNGLGICNPIWAFSHKKGAAATRLRKKIELASQDK